MWARFQVGFVELWSDEELHKGQAYLRAMYSDTAGLEEAQVSYMRRLWQVNPCFAACMHTAFTRLLGFWRPLGWGNTGSFGKIVPCSAVDPGLLL